MSDDDEKRRKAWRTFGKIEGLWLGTDGNPTLEETTEMKWLVEQLGELLGVKLPTPEDSANLGKLIANLAEVLRQPQSTMH